MANPEHDLALGMDIPDSPEALFEQLAEPTLRELFPKFDSIPPRNQKLVRLIHTELVKGELSDAAFQQFVGFLLLLWKSFNQGAMVRNDQRLDDNDDIESDWISQGECLHRMDQYLASLLALLETIPVPTAEDSPEPGNQYMLRPSEDFPDPDEV